MEEEDGKEEDDDVVKHEDWAYVKIDLKLEDTVMHMSVL